MNELTQQLILTNGTMNTNCIVVIYNSNGTNYPLINRCNDCGYTILASS